MSGPPAFLREPALARVLDALPEARVVGGAVRDTLARRPVTEVDLATPRTTDQVTQALQAAGIREDFAASRSVDLLQGNRARVGRRLQ